MNRRSRDARRFDASSRNATADNHCGARACAPCRARCRDVLDPSSRPTEQGCSRMLLKELMALLPAELGQTALYVALGVAGAGLVLWFAGARFSRQIVALLCTGAGAVLGMRAPQLYGWNVSGAGVAVAGAIAAGVA